MYPFPYSTFSLVPSTIVVSRSLMFWTIVVMEGSSFKRASTKFFLEGKAGPLVTSVTMIWPVALAQRTWIAFTIPYPVRSS